MPAHRKGRMRSQAQWRFLFARRKPFARRWAHNTPGPKKVRYRRLPRRKGTRRRR